MTDTSLKLTKQDIVVSRCDGLLKRSARKEKTGEVVYADDAYKNDGPYFCDTCLSEAVVRKCSEKVDHFAHKARQSKIIGRKDIELHNKCRDELLQEFIKAFPDGNWSKERTIPANFKDKGNKEIRPDLSGKIGNKGIAVEVQASAYTIEKIYNKTIEYQKLGIAVIWIVPLKVELGTEPFRPRLFEKYLHSLYFGKTYYYSVGSKSIIQTVHYSPTKRWIEETEWYSEDAELMSAGGHFLTYRTLKSPNFGSSIDLTKDFTVKPNTGFIPKNAKKAIPNSILFCDNLKSWWQKDEFKNEKKQLEIIRKTKAVFDDYDFIDDYDEEDGWGD